METLSPGFSNEFKIFVESATCSLLWSRICNTIKEQTWFSVAQWEGACFELALEKTLAHQALSSWALGDEEDLQTASDGECVFAIEKIVSSE